MPKTAGVSFRGALEGHYGDRFRHDYRDYPLAQLPQERRERAMAWGRTQTFAEFEGVECVHGHFLPLKYLPLAAIRPCTFVTWLREPLTRLVSHYQYWLRSYDPAAGDTSSLHRRVVEEQWSLRRFCLAPELRNVYTEFLWGFPLERFDFVGITEFYAEDLRYFSQEILGNKLEPQTLNQGVVDSARTATEALSRRERVEILDFHAADMSLYRRALVSRERR